MDYGARGIPRTSSSCFTANYDIRTVQELLGRKDVTMGESAEALKRSPAELEILN